MRARMNYVVQLGVVLARVTAHPIIQCILGSRMVASAPTCVGFNAEHVVARDFARACASIGQYGGRPGSHVSY